MPQAKTLKQAKAAYKTRSEQPLTEREQKQLERSLQLDRRAWALREREKTTRLDTAKKRAAQEKAQREEQARLGTQRRCDKFGFASSQFHLGAFFRRPAAPMAERADEMEGRDAGEGVGGPVIADARESADEREETKNIRADEAMDLNENEFEDLDDDSLLEALQPSERIPSPTGNPSTKDQIPQAAISMPPPPRPPYTKSSFAHVPPEPAHRLAFVPPATNKPSPDTDWHKLLDSSDTSVPSKPSHRPTFVPPANQKSSPDLEWHDFLDSSSQIARDLNTESSLITGPNTPRAPPKAPATALKEPSRKSSFSSGSFELTEDDIEQLDPTPSCNAQVPLDKPDVNIQLSPRLSIPPMTKADGKNVVSSRRENNTTRSNLKDTYGASRVFRPGYVAADTKPYESVESQCPPSPGLWERPGGESATCGFTLTQLESFVEEELELTQAG